jgi:hypothetical protein
MAVVKADLQDLVDKQVDHLAEKALADNGNI